ncbi:MAG: hypothetical protein JXR61_06925 [Prolixibacteraceae bacterium]|nr:hypothetical protein [Prolixibacteraceae bacterium]
MQLNKILVLLILVILMQPTSGQSRKIIHIPNIPGYQTLKCDFHVHTVFSDGTVWPTVRVEEAWEEGLDAIAITDHIEYRPHSIDITANHNRSFEIAAPLAKELQIILVKGAEITRNMPPGHFNTLFISNANLLEREDVFEALQEARDQGAFIVWNHPGWKAQQPDSTLWWPQHTRLYNSKLLNGIEVFNDREYYPEAVTWAGSKKLTVFANSDAHGPIKIENGHRPMTLVFAKSRTQAGIKEALMNQRTIAWFNNTLVGKSQLLNQLFFASLELSNLPLQLENKVRKYIYIRNNSEIDYELELVQPGIGFDAPESIRLKAQHVTPVQLTGNSDEVMQMKELDIYYQVKNLITDKGEGLIATFSLRNTE